MLSKVWHSYIKIYPNRKYPWRCHTILKIHFKEVESISYSMATLWPIRKPFSNYPHSKLQVMMIHDDQGIYNAGMVQYSIIMYHIISILPIKFWSLSRLGCGTCWHASSCLRLTGMSPSFQRPALPGAALSFVAFSPAEHHQVSEGVCLVVLWLGDGSWRQ